MADNEDTNNGKGFDFGPSIRGAIAFLEGEHLWQKIIDSSSLEDTQMVVNKLTPVIGEFANSDITAGTIIVSAIAFVDGILKAIGDVDDPVLRASVISSAIMHAHNNIMARKEQEEGSPKQADPQADDFVVNLKAMLSGDKT